MNNSKLENVKFGDEMPLKGSGLTIKSAVNSDGKEFFFGVFSDGSRCCIGKSVKEDLERGGFAAIDANRASICAFSFQQLSDNGELSEVQHSKLLYYSSAKTLGTF